MNQTIPQSWEDFNQASMRLALADLRATLVRFIAPTEPEHNQSQISAEAAGPLQPESAQDEGPSPQTPPAFDILCATFGLSTFERNILLMCAAVELDSRFADLYQSANKGQCPALPTFSLALAAFEDAHWSALLPGRPLRNWHLVEVLSGDALTSSPLRIDERILHYLTGIQSFDERLRGLVEPVHATGKLTPSEQRVAQRMADALSHGNWQAAAPVVYLSGSEPGSRRAVAARACALAGMNLQALSGQAVPRGATELDLFLRLWEREAALQSCGLLLEYDDSPPLDAAGEFAVNRLIETLRSPLLVSTREPMQPVERRLLSFEVPTATANEQIELWHQALGVAAPLLNGELDTLAAQFSLSARRIDAAVNQTAPELESLAGSAGNGAAHALASALWDACRAQSRPRLEGLAQRIEPIATCDDLVLPDKQKQLLAQIAIHVRQRAKVYRSWGFASKVGRGLGISALFAGPSGTGKTMAGEVLANQLRLDLYRIDLSQVISKYIGETEKNLRRVFDAAEESAAILLFDEADALFGKRSEVKDSHDRYANIEVSYLLQRMEAYRGLAILTTNRRDALDTAFLRRIRFVVEFPFPEAAQRAEIWQRVFPRQTPTEGLRVDQLARLSAAGGNIQNIAMGAAFLAADAGEPVRMSHLLSAARSEFTKIERPLADSETAGWA
jgi:hypothetical protein